MPPCRGRPVDPAAEYQVWGQAVDRFQHGQPLQGGLETPRSGGPGRVLVVGAVGASLVSGFACCEGGATLALQVDLINDLLDVDRIDAGTLFLTTEATVLVDRARNTFLSGGGRSNLRIKLPPVTTDRRRIVQMLLNPPSNAARNSPESSTIRLSTTWDGVHVAFTVADEGVGIALERVPYLFLKFSREDGEEQSSIGAGLELAICRGILEAHGGRIWAESGGPGPGARFTFILPAVEAADTLLPDWSTARRRRRGRQQVRVLVVDDDPQTLRYVRGALSIADYRPVVTGDPEEAF